MPCFILKRVIYSSMSREGKLKFGTRMLCNRQFFEHMPQDGAERGPATYVYLRLNL